MDGELGRVNGDVIRTREWTYGRVAREREWWPMQSGRGRLIRREGAVSNRCKLESSRPNRCTCKSFSLQRWPGSSSSVNHRCSFMLGYQHVFRCKRGREEGLTSGTSVREGDEGSLAVLRAMMTRHSKRDSRPRVCSAPRTGLGHVLSFAETSLSVLGKPL